MTWTNKEKNTSTWGNRNKIKDQTLLIEGVYELLIDDNFSLFIQQETRWANKSKS